MSDFADGAYNTRVPSTPPVSIEVETTGPWSTTLLPDYEPLPKLFLPRTHRVYPIQHPGALLWRTLPFAEHTSRIEAIDPSVLLDYDVSMPNPIKPGFFPHHTEDCDLEFKYEKASGTLSNVYRAFWCKTHGQWCYERPVSVVWTWADNTTSSPSISPRPTGGVNSGPQTKEEMNAH